MMAVIAPIALLIAAIYVLTRLSGDSELIVMTWGGMAVWTLLKPLGLLALSFRWSLPSSITWSVPPASACCGTWPPRSEPI